MADPDIRYYAYKLFPPRSSFPADITEAEAAIMAEHIAYWTELLSAGTAVVFGPVADPGGAWGLAVVEADADTDLDQLRERDPVIRRGLGGRVEIYPMPSAIARPGNQHPDAVKRDATGDEPSLG